MNAYNFMGWKNFATILSASLVLLSIFSLSTKHLNLGLDFTGGIVVELAYKNPVNLDQVRSTLAEAGYDDAVVQFFGKSTDIMVRLAPQEGKQAAIAKHIVEVLSVQQSDTIELKRVEFVGPQVGDELRDQSGIALIVALICMMIYVLVRFDFKFSVGAVTALFHDVLITLGIFSFWQIPFDLTVLAAVLAVIGYSINDTIVVFDRVRENFRLMRKSEPVDVFNEALTQTLGRTTITSGTTLLVVIALYVFGGELIHGFSLALLIGITVGTYSSIFVASSIALTMGITKEHFIDNVDAEVVDDRP